MSTPNVPCAHVFTTARHIPIGRRKNGAVHVDVIDCADCDAKVILRVYDDPRDDPFSRRPMTWGENYRATGTGDGEQK
ncbi:hypothetical protein [Isoptericola sp. NPDC057191]|uniref:hypothetical protein n=1 Tax=Isoptericola sp. NPDC057191 TaxID=3346041 RepID=UPI00363C05D9